MKKYILMFSLFIGFSLIVMGGEKDKVESKQSLSGIVKDKTTGELLTGVSIEVQGYDLKTFSDFDGVFKIIPPKTSNLVLKVNYISYEEEIMNVNIHDLKDNKVMIELTNIK